MNLARTDPAAAIGYLDRVPPELRATLDQRRRRGLRTERRARRGQAGSRSTAASPATTPPSPPSPAALRSTTPSARRGCSTRSTRARRPTRRRARSAIAVTLGAAGRPGGRELGARARRRRDRRGEPSATSRANGSRATPRRRATGRSACRPGATRDAALVQLLGATAERTRRPHAARRILEPEAQQRGVERCRAHHRARDPAAARRLADQYLTDPGARQAAERFIEQRRTAQRSGRPRRACRRGAEPPARARLGAARANPIPSPLRVCTRGNVHVAPFDCVRCARSAPSLASAALAQPSGDAAKLLRGVAAAPVTDAMLRNPDPADWLMYSRTYDAQRYSPLDRDRSRQRRLARSARGRSRCRPGQLEIIPLVYRGVMYLTTPGSRDGGSRVVALNAATGETLWEYVPPNAASSRIKALAIYGDMIYYTAPAPSGEPNPVIALDAATGAVRWQTPVTVETHTAGAIVVEGKVISGRACNTARSNCYHRGARRAHGQRSVAVPHEPRRRRARRRVVGRHARRRAARGDLGLARHATIPCADSSTGASRTRCRTRAPTGTAATSTRSRATRRPISTATRRSRCNPDTGELVWHYQHLPGDDWDMDINEEKTLIRTVVDPDPRHVKWINPNVRERRRARRRDHGRRRRRRLAQRPRDGRVPLGDAVPVRHAALHSRRHRRRDRRRAHQLRSCCSTSPARRSSSATGTRAASGRRRTRRRRTRCTCRTSITA